MDTPNSSVQHYQSPKGLYDILPEITSPEESWKQVDRWHFVEQIIRSTVHDYGYREIRTPIFEHTELFYRGVGEATDIVSKEMYTFEDRGGRSLTLRPEGTTAVMRAYVEHRLYQQAPFHKLYYIGPMFRYERPQAGRYRQHIQFGAEAIGSNSPEQDVEMIDMIYTVYQRLGLKHLQVMLNSVGDTESRQKYRSALVAYLHPKAAELSEESRRRLETNPFRILDSKNPADRQALVGAPTILDYLNDACQTHFQAVCTLLKALNIPYALNPQLVRGLDYYVKTVFEVTSGELGAQNSIVGGGRYDGLIRMLGGPDLPGVGFGCGLERVLQTMLAQNAPFPVAPHPKIFLVALGTAARTHCLTLLKTLRTAGIAAEMDFSDRKLKASIRYADSLRAKYLAVIGDNELSAQELELKELATGQTRKISFTELLRL